MVLLDRNDMEACSYGEAVQSSPSTFYEEDTKLFDRRKLALETDARVAETVAEQERQHKLSTGQMYQYMRSPADRGKEGHRLLVEAAQAEEKRRQEIV